MENFAGKKVIEEIFYVSNFLACLSIDRGLMERHASSGKKLPAENVTPAPVSVVYKSMHHNHWCAVMFSTVNF